MSLTLYNSVFWGIEKQTVTSDGNLDSPTLLSAASLSPTKVRLTFDRNMRQELSQGLPNREGTLAITSYRITKVIGGSTLHIVRTVQVDKTHVDLITADQTSGSYEVTALAGGAMDESGNTISEQTVSFVGTAPSGYGSPSTLHLFSTGYPGLQDDTVTDFYPDVAPPYLDNRVPNAGDTGVAPNTLIAFDLKDDGEGIDLSTVLVYVEGALAYRGSTDSFIAPYNGPGSARTTIQGGHHFVIDPTSDFAEYTLVDVNVYALDAAPIPNELDTTYSFRIQDQSAPYLNNLNPNNGASNVSVTAHVFLDVLDAGAGVNPASVLIEINGSAAWQGEAQQPGFTVVRTPIPGGHRYEIAKATPFDSYQTVSVHVYAEDLVS